MFLGVKPSKKVIELFNDKISILNQFIGNRNYVVGNHLTLADLSIYSIEPYIEIMGFPLHQYPNVIRWINQIRYDCSYLNKISSSDEIEDFINSIKNNPKIMDLPRRTSKWFFCIPFESKSKRYQSYDQVVTNVASIRPFYNAVDVINAIHLANSM